MSRESAVFMAKCSEQAERFDEMVNYMKQVAQLKVELTVEERNLLSVAYKNIIGTRRASWRVISAIEQQQKDEERKKMMQEYKKTIEKELESICKDIIDILDKYLIPNCGSDESLVFHYKLKGDYYRYLGEFKHAAEKKDAAKEAEAAYSKADEYSKRLTTTHPIRLGLALNYSVFFYEIMGDSDRACQQAKQAFESAIEELDTLSEESYKDSTLIMQLLKDNLTLWSGDASNQEEEIQVEDLQE